MTEDKARIARVKAIPVGGKLTSPCGMSDAQSLYDFRSLYDFSFSDYSFYLRESGCDYPGDS